MRPFLGSFIYLTALGLVPTSAFPMMGGSPQCHDPAGTQSAAVNQLARSVAVLSGGATEGTEPPFENKDRILDFLIHKYSAVGATETDKALVRAQLATVFAESVDPAIQDLKSLFSQDPRPDLPVYKEIEFMREVEVLSPNVRKLLPTIVWLLPDGTISMDWDEIVLGKGASKVVHLAAVSDSPLGSPSEVMRVSWNSRLTPQLQKELHLQKVLYEDSNNPVKIASPGVVIPFQLKVRPKSRPIDVWDDEIDETPSEHTPIHVIQPFYNAGSAEQVRRLSADNLQYFASQLFTQLEEMHQKDIVHFDLKPQNVLLHQTEKDSTAHFSDFGSAAQIELNDEFKRILASGTGMTPTFLPPERASFRVPIPDSKDPEAVRQWKEAIKKGDVWAFGLTLFAMLQPKPGKPLVYGCQPIGGDGKRISGPMALFYQISRIRTYDDLCRVCQHFCDSSGTKTEAPSPNTFEHLIYQMLNPDFDARPNMATLKAQLHELELFQENSVQ